MIFTMNFQLCGMASNSFLYCVHPSVLQAVKQIIGLVTFTAIFLLRRLKRCRKRHRRIYSREKGKNAEFSQFYKRLSILAMFLCY